MKACCGSRLRQVDEAEMHLRRMAQRCARTDTPRNLAAVTEAKQERDRRRAELLEHKELCNDPMIALPMPKGRVLEATPAKEPKADQRRRSHPMPTAEQITLAQQTTLAQVSEHGGVGSTRGTDLRPQGACYTCGRAVTGQRRYCGPCLAEHRL